MCHHCQPPSANPLSRRAFLGKLGVGALAGLSGLAGVAPAGAAGRELPVGSAASWARLITPNPFWSLHCEQDARIAAFLRDEAGLPVAAASYGVDPASAKELAAFPFLASNGVESIVEPRAVENLHRHLENGGFLFVEGCLDRRVTRNFGVFMAGQVAWFKQLYPGISGGRFAPTHAISRARFPVDEKNLGLIDPAPDDLRWKAMSQALHGIYAGDRLLAVISLQHLQCEWFTKPEKIPHALRQLANIYAYAMTR